MTLIISILIILAISGAMCFGIHLEKKAFSKGSCICCGSSLRLFDVDSHGSRGYKCDKCGYITWVSYWAVDRDYFNSHFNKDEGEKNDQT